MSNVMYLWSEKDTPVSTLQFRRFVVEYAREFINVTSMMLSALVETNVERFPSFATNRSLSVRSAVELATWRTSFR
jgi:hypothetical protein